VTVILIPLQNVFNSLCLVSFTIYGLLISMGSSIFFKNIYVDICTNLAEYVQHTHIFLLFDVRRN
jgi:hypothetical protein